MYHIMNILTELNLVHMVSKLFYLTTTADGNMNAKEIAIGKKLIEDQGIQEEKFQDDLKLLENMDHEEVYRAYLEDLKNLDKNMQIYYIAWMTLIANSDGFMERNEWQLIFKIYHKELKLDLKDIMYTQRDLIEKTRK